MSAALFVGINEVVIPGAFALLVLASAVLEILAVCASGHGRFLLWFCLFC